MGIKSNGLFIFYPTDLIDYMKEREVRMISERNNNTDLEEMLDLSSDSSDDEGVSFSRNLVLEKRTKHLNDSISQFNSLYSTIAVVGVSKSDFEKIAKIIVDLSPSVSELSQLVPKQFLRDFDPSFSNLFRRKENPQPKEMDLFAEQKIRQKALERQKQLQKLPVQFPTQNQSKSYGRKNWLSKPSGFSRSSQKFSNKN